MDNVNQALEKALLKMLKQTEKRIDVAQRKVLQEQENIKHIKFEIAKLQEEELQRKTPS